MRLRRRHHHDTHHLTSSTSLRHRHRASHHMAIGCCKPHDFTRTTTSLHWRYASLLSSSAKKTSGKESSFDFHPATIVFPSSTLLDYTPFVRAMLLCIGLFSSSCRNGADGRATRQYHPPLQTDAQTSPCHDFESLLQPPLACHEMPVSSHKVARFLGIAFRLASLVTCHRLPDGI